MLKKSKAGGVNFECAILVLLTALIWIVTCVTKHVWPFGQMVIDVGDMMEQYVPMYTFLWDVMHGHKSLFFDWDTGLGNNMAGAALHFGLISPFNLFFFFVRRSAIEASMSVYILIKLIAIGLGMRFVLKKWVPGLSGGMGISFSLLYVFCVFNMQYYYAVMWLDVSFMFPLVMYSYFLLMNEGKSALYVICLVVTCMMNFQHTYILFLMLLLLSGILLLLARERYCGALPKLLTATLIAMMISAWIWIPGAIQILGSTRTGLRMSLTEIYNSIWLFFTAKWMKLLNLGIPIAFFLAYAIRHLEQKSVKFFGFMGIALCAPICLESTNILWHGGPYQGYTMRFSYMLAFWILAAGAYMFDALGREENCRTEGRKRRVFDAKGVLYLLLLSGVMAFQYVIMKKDATVYKQETSSLYVIFVIVAAVCVGLLLCSRAALLEKVFIYIVVLQSLSLALTSIWVLGEKENTLFALGSTVAEREEDDNPLSRIKSLDIGGVTNYPLTMQKSGLSCYLGVNTAKQLGSMSGLGYAKVGYRMSSLGGTAFSDAMLGVKEAFGSGEVNDELYQYQDTHRDCHFYQCPYQYSDGIKIAAPLPVTDYEGENPFAYQNQLADKLLGKELFDVVFEGGGNEIDLTIEGKSILYLYAEREVPLEAASETVTVTDTESGAARSYEFSSSGWMKGILELGTWENASLKIEIHSNETMRKVYCAALNLQDFRETQPVYFDNFQMDSGKNSMNIVLEGAGEKEYLLLPLYCDDDWKCSVNGFRTEIEEFAGFLTAVPLQAGKNEIKLSFVPIGLKTGICVTALGLVLLLIICKFPMKREWEPAGKILFVLDEAAFSILMVVFYILPVIFFVKEIVRIMF